MREREVPVQQRVCRRAVRLPRHATLRVRRRHERDSNARPFDVGVLHNRDAGRRRPSAGRLPDCIGGRRGVFAGRVLPLRPVRGLSLAGRVPLLGACHCGRPCAAHAAGDPPQVGGALGGGRLPRGRACRRCVPSRVRNCVRRDAQREHRARLLWRAAAAGEPACARGHAAHPLAVGALPPRHDAGPGLRAGAARAGPARRGERRGLLEVHRALAECSASVRPP
mmetsp:Transcript_12697/g.50750  ORF Transcript_12697/g.50750 Transcript_12697/m.50750 type:complete len:224 (-) Transcript_12697:508-1179(-)